MAIIDENNFTGIFNGSHVLLKKLKNKSGTEIYISNYGARIIGLIYQNVDIVVGYEKLEHYLASSEFFYGATIGRFANRIKEGKFSLKEKEYQLEINNPPNHLHGGANGFHNKVWTIEESSDKKVRLFYFSPDGEGGYPGNLKVSLTYSLNDDDELILDYKAVTDATTICNLTHHSFFNLNGQGKSSILNHHLFINADTYLPIDKNMIPTGEIAKVENTPFDFRKERFIGESIKLENEQLELGNGYDHNFVLNKSALFDLAARAIGDQSNITMEVYTDQPGMQLYSGNFMKGSNEIKYGLKDYFRSAFCLETQHFPDSPNQFHFPTTILEKGDEYLSKTIYKLSIK